MHSPPEPLVMAWLDRQDRSSLAITSVNLLEVRFGLLTMPEGQRRRARESAFQVLLRRGLPGRILPFDAAAAEATAELEARRKAVGRAVGVRDAQIAGIAIANTASICTRNTRHFDDAGVPLYDPWG